MSQEKAIQDQQMREAFHQSYIKFYSDMISFLNRLPLNPQIKAYCFMNFDQGSMWAREAIANIQFETSPVPPVIEEIKSEPTECDHGLHAILDCNVESSVEAA